MGRRWDGLSEYGFWMRTKLREHAREVGWVLGEPGKKKIKCRRHNRWTWLASDAVTFGILKGYPAKWVCDKCLIEALTYQLELREQWLDEVERRGLAHGISERTVGVRRESLYRYRAERYAMGAAN